MILDYAGGSRRKRIIDDVNTPIRNTKHRRPKKKRAVMRKRESDLQLLQKEFYCALEGALSLCAPPPSFVAQNIA